jgi:hypothetical protein
VWQYGQTNCGNDTTAALNVRFTNLRGLLAAAIGTLNTLAVS